MDKNKTYLEEAFKALNDISLNEDVFELTTDGLEDADNFMNMDFDDVEDIIDVNATEKEDLKDSYIGNVILDCNVCHSKLYKKPEEVVIDEETEIANIEEACPYCQSNDGYLVIGQVAEYCDHCEDEEKHEDEAEEEVKEEALKESYTRDDLFDLISEKDMKKVDELLTGDGDGDIFYTLGDAMEVAEKINSLNIPGLTAYAEYIDKDDVLYGGYDAYVNFKYNRIDEAIKTRKKVRTEELKEEEELEEAKKARHKIGSSNLEKVKKVLDSLKEDKDLDDIDADADDKKEKAEAEKEKADDDADADRDYRLKRKGLKESDKPAAISIEDAQKWVDYDMKKYGKISGRTNRLVKKAGFQILKDDHGDYEVAAGKFESCNEDFERVDIETDREKMSMTADEDGKVTVTTEPKEDIKEEEEEVIAPVSDEVKAEFKTTEEENEEDEYADIDIDEFDEEEFDSLGEQYLRRVYENVKSFKTTSGAVNGNHLKLEGLITFKSGKQAKTNFMFEARTVTKTGKLKFIGENKQFAKGKKSFTLTGKMDGKKLITESLTYNYKAKDLKTGDTKRLYGRVVR